MARVLAQGAEIILADEPVSNLDPALADDILGLLVEISQRRGATLVMSVHQPALAQRYAERVIGLREGGIVFDGSSQALTDSVLHAIYDREIKVAIPKIVDQGSQNFFQGRQPILNGQAQEVKV